MKKVKEIINRFLRPLGLKMVNAKWGPRGFANVFREIASSGIAIEQVVDIGASNGQWTHECREIWPDAKYFLVDPLVENELSLQRMKSDIRGLGYYLGALSSKPGSMILNHHGDQSSFHPSEFGHGAESQRSIPVETLDNLLKQGCFSPPDLIKIDVQGHELQVLAGAIETLKSAKILLIECNIQQSYHGIPFFHEVVSFLGDHDFRVFDFCTYAQRPFDLRLTQTDVVFAKGLPELFIVRWK